MEALRLPPGGARSKRTINRSTEHQIRLRSQFEAEGFIFFRAPEAGLPSRSTPAQEALVRQAQTLPVDRHSDGNRFRCLHYGIYIPGKRRIIFARPEVDPDTGEEFIPYYQGDENPEHAHVVRRFAPMPLAMRKNAALHEIVRRDFQLAPFSSAERKNRFGFGVTLHVIRHTVRPGEKVASSPDVVHKDNVLVSFVHVIERYLVEGGVNCITRSEHAGKQWRDVPVPDVLAQATVTGAFDGYAFRDDIIGHYVSAIEAASTDRIGARTILIVDFAPLREDLVLRAALIGQGHG